MHMKKYSNEGLGTVYERFMLNNFFDRLIDTYALKDVLEVPLHGMTGLTGINSFHFTERNCRITLVDSRKESVSEAIDLLTELPCTGKYSVLCRQNLHPLPFPDRSFDLVWNFSALWHLENAKSLLAEMARVSSNLVLVFVTNKMQMGYFLRKHFFEPGFFRTILEKWTEIERINSLLSRAGLNLVEQGVLDVPPWPDTCFPIGKIFEKIKPRAGKSADKAESKGFWTWDIMEHYLGRDTSLKKTIERLSFLEKLPIAWQLKALWAHHRYSLFSKA